MIRSLKFRLALGGFAAIILSLTLVWVSLLHIFAQYVADRYQSEMNVVADILASNIAYRDGRFELANPPPDPRFSAPAGGRYWQISAPGQPPIRSPSLWDTAIDPAKLTEKDRLGFQRIEGPDGSTLLVSVSNLTLTSGRTTQSPPFTIYCAFPMTELTQSLDKFGTLISTMMGVTALVLMGAGLAMGYLAVWPLDRLRRDVADIRSGRIKAMTEEGPTETLPLVHEINMLLHERASAVERARARASDLAHGLKTPLTVLAQLATRLPPVDRTTALKQVDLIRQRSDRQLQSARLGVEQMASTRVSDITTKLSQVLNPVTAARGLNWHILIEPDLSVATDPADLAEAIGNVLENASKWAKEHILVRADQVGNWIDIAIADDGPGADEVDYERMLRRGGFLSVNDDATGLGLAISADIASAYGGSLSLARSELGGLQVVLRFPATMAERHSPA